MARIGAVGGRHRAILARQPFPRGLGAQGCAGICNHAWPGPVMLPACQETWAHPDECVAVCAGGADLGHDLDRPQMAAGPCAPTAVDRLPLRPGGLAAVCLADLAAPAGADAR